MHPMSEKVRAISVRVRFPVDDGLLRTPSNVRGAPAQKCIDSHQRRMHDFIPSKNRVVKISAKKREQCRAVAALGREGSVVKEARQHLVDRFTVKG